MAYLLGEADAKLVSEIEHWLALSEENKALLNELEDAEPWGIVAWVGYISTGMPTQR